MTDYNAITYQKIGIVLKHQKYTAAFSSISSVMPVSSVIKSSTKYSLEYSSSYSASSGLTSVEYVSIIVLSFILIADNSIM